MDKVDTRQAEVVTAEPVVANEHMREVRAPPGPLGVSFDANDTSHRVIGVRPASPLARHVAVGDRLVRISTPGRAPLMCGPTVTGRDITDELRAGASSGGRVLSFAGYPLMDKVYEAQADTRQAEVVTAQPVVVGANTPQAPGWFWQEADGTWIPYRPGDSDELDRMKATGRPNAIVAGVYKVDFRTMTQTNTRTGFRRPVCRSHGTGDAVVAEVVGRQEHMLEVRAPSGPLGVVFDANDTSHCVSAVRPESPLAPHVAVGSRLVSISTPGRAPFMCGPTVTGLAIMNELRAGASSGGRVLSFAPPCPLIPSAEIGGCYTFPCGVARWCSPCEDHVCGAYVGLIPPFVWPFLCFQRGGTNCKPKIPKNPNYYIGTDEYGNGWWVLVKDRDTLGFGQVCCYAPSEPECCECRRCGSGQA